MPSPLATPLQNTVLPAPISPFKITTSFLLSFFAYLSPNSIVCSGDCETKTAIREYYTPRGGFLQLLCNEFYFKLLLRFFVFFADWGEFFACEHYEFRERLIEQEGCYGKRDCFYEVEKHSPVPYLYERGHSDLPIHSDENGEIEQPVYRERP